MGAACSLWRGVWRSRGKTNQQQHNKALHPTARSVVVFAALRLDSKLVVTGGRRVSLALCRARLLLMRVSALGSSVAAVVWLVAAVLASGLSWLQLAGVGSFALRVAKPNNTRHNQALHPTARSVVVFPAFSLC